MKILRKIAVGVLSLCITLCFTQASFAQNVSKKELSRDQKIVFLQKEGMPLRILEKSSDIYIDELLKDDGEFVNVREVGFNVDENGAFQKVYDSDITTTTEGGISIADLDPSTEFGQIITVQRIKEKTGDNFKFTSHGIWNIDPYFHMTDVAAIAWSDNFSLYYDSCTYNNYVNGSWVSRNCTRNNVNPEAGVSHNVVIPNGTDFAGGEYTQVAKVNLYPGSTGSGNVVAQYAHKTLGVGGITAGFSGGIGSTPSISFSANINTTYDESVPTYEYFEY